jgi:hypothetical protein
LQVYAAVGAGEERIFPVDDDIDGAVVELDMAVIKEARQSLQRESA